MKKTKDAFNNSKIKVPFVSPDITREDKAAINKALRSSLLTDGPTLQKFEQAFSKYTGSKYAIGVSNATSALELSLVALNIKQGDEVIVPDMTFVATASAVLHCSATPVLADVEEETMNISTESIKRNLSSKTKAIIPVHFAGQICNIKEIKKIASANNLFVIEDCAHALGTKLDSKHVGTFGDTGCFSFYPTKNFTTIEGGMIITNSKKISDYVHRARNHGIIKSLQERFIKGKPWDYDVHDAGFNYRLDEIRSALGLTQMKRLDKMNLMRKNASKYYDSQLRNIQGIVTPSLSHDKENSFHLYVIKIKPEYGISRDRLFEKLTESGIRTSVHYKPLQMFSIFRKKAKWYEKPKTSRKLYEEIISLPMFSSITQKEQDLVINCIKNNQK